METDETPFGWWVETHSTRTNKFFRDEVVAREYLRSNSYWMDDGWYLVTLYAKRWNKE